MLDCAATVDYSCERGETLLTALNFPAAAPGLTDLHNYPYVAVQGTCDSTRVLNPAQFQAPFFVNRGASNFQAALAQGPLVIGMPIDR